MKLLRRYQDPVLLALVLVLALAVRVYGLNFPPHYHWDEQITFDNVLYASFSHLQLPTYVHGSFVQYLILSLWYTALILRGQQPSAENLLRAFFHNSTLFILLARSLLALAGTATVAVAYALGRYLYSRTVGLIAAFFLALTFLHVSESHYARGHILSAFFVTVAVYYCARILRAGRTRDYLLAGVATGLAIAAQYSAVIGFFPLVLAHGMRMGQSKAGKRDWLLNRALLLGIDSAAATFFLVTPYALLNYRFFAGEMKWFLTHVLSHPWVSSEGQPVLLFYLTEHLRNGMGTPLEITALAGAAYALYQREPQDLILLAFPIPLFLSLGKGENFARYALPLLPFLAIAASRLLVDAVRAASRFLSSRRRHIFLGAVMVGLIFPSAVRVAQYDFLITQPDTRQLASRWIKACIPAESTIVAEGSGVLGPSIPPSVEYVDLWMARVPADSFTHFYLQEKRPFLQGGVGYHVDQVFRLDRVHDTRGMSVGTIADAQYYASRGVDYLVTVNWMQRDDADRYTPTFQASLNTAYKLVKEFRPTVSFRFDPYAWRMDYDALGHVVPGRPLVGGPRLRIYRAGEVALPQKVSCADPANP